MHCTGFDTLRRMQWPDITNSCCVSVWNMKSSQYTPIFSAQGLNWAIIYWSCFPVSAAMLSSFSHMNCKSKAWGKQCLMLQQVFNSSMCAMCDLSLTYGSMSSFCFCFVTDPQCLHCGKKHLRWDRAGQTHYVKHEASAIVTKKMEQYALRVPAHSKPQPSWTSPSSKCDGDPDAKELFQ